MRQGRRSAVRTLLGGAALCLPLHRGLGAQTNAPPLPPDTTDLLWHTGTSQATDGRAYNLRTVKTPQYRAMCFTEVGVAKAYAWAIEHSMPFSVLSGGHCFEGFSQNDHLIIDLRHLNETQLTVGNTLVAGPGATLGKVNLAAAQTDHALPAGYCQGVGLGGHIGGGGLGVLSRRFGLASDHLESARVLLADGRIVTASSDENSDLFWALRGGGSGSFGIVTSSTFRLQHVPTVALAEFFWILDNNACAQFLTDWQALSQSFNRGISCYAYVKSHKRGQALVRVRMISTAGSTETTNAIGRLNALAPSLTEPAILTGNFQYIADQVWPRTYNPTQNIKIASNFLGSPALADTWLNLLLAIDEHHQDNANFTIETLGGAIDDKTPGQTAYFHRRGPSFLVQFAVYFTPENDPERTLGTLRSVQKQLKPATISGAYINYPDRDLVDWQTQYWGTNYPRLRRIKRQYDPNNIFQHPHSIGV